MLIPTTPFPGGSSELPFQLIPFPGSPHPADLSIEGMVCRTPATLRILYRLQGAIRQLKLRPASVGVRRDGLWQSTCLEAFLARPGDRRYWELNVSPTGAWNVYRFSDYRQGQQPEPADGPPLLLINPSPTERELLVELPLPRPLAAASQLELAITAVIETKGGALSYWALSHSGAEPDFHRRDTFLLRL